jgi:hypothetical protein
MKKLLTPLLLCGMTSGLFAGGSSGGPWANGAYYSGYLNGKYMGVVTGDNIAGVLGFAITDGAPPFRPTADTAEGASSTSIKVSEYGDPRYDITQNYFAIFVEGRTYTGLTVAGIDIDNNTVAGALQGTDPIGVQATVTGAPGPGNFANGFPTITTSTTTNTVTNTNLGPPIVVTVTSSVTTASTTNFANPPFDNALSILNRGLSGGFTADIKTKGAIFTFKGDGELSTPANKQSFTASGYTQQKLAGDPPPAVPTGQLTNLFVTGQYSTDTTSFKVRGIRTSFNTLNLQASLDQGAAANASSTGGGAAGGN